ncbi:ATP-binding cassette domain-containing protein [Pediococcus pentosaceus]|uniref:ATP-binding cassette domain-containing protein n=1 Tax=Pediococcus pentosaceus TaxID=1255 RepID=UPI002F264864
MAENIALGNLQQTSQDKIIWAANVAEISKDIEKWPDKYNTKISIDGTLSGGQQQRIAIARALLSSSKIIIFDEATSNLDVMTEQKVINNILQIPGKTFIFIAHRLKVAQQVKEVFVMQDGKIIEHGSHNALLKKHGQYYNFLYN